MSIKQIIIFVYAFGLLHWDTYVIIVVKKVKTKMHLTVGGDS